MNENFQWILRTSICIFLSLAFIRYMILFLTVQSYRILWTGLGAQLARDVPFSAICWSTLEPVSYHPFKTFQWIQYNIFYVLLLHICPTWYHFSCCFVQIRRRILGLVGDEASAPCILGANFSGGFVAGILAAAATCPLDVAKTRKQIEVFFLQTKLH